MNVISVTEFRKLSMPKIKELMPLKLLADGEPVAFVGHVDDFIYIGDMHPRVQNQFRAREELVRSGMTTRDIRVDYAESMPEEA
jgi:hypothetical protein